ncbi:hypothetical protein BU26DRAFT_562346 [Trematosphaeria pertusa]|uniref:Uncharacterized protein n=1 Tax=Trematosphaeria pertusa TaxID=390896 RepID=A0A6A6IRB1_9PLEO|nr:uncharacterized protein BU26DRAFT_562346 [Trematosphaeria pertusa]KAF2252618.1 hypothetical protein BU26DRAFT_562346 [Trematosphaeria pertusa]
MPHSKTPGQSNAAAPSFLKKDAEAHGLGAPNAPAHKEQPAPGERPVASDSGNANVGVDAGANQRGEKRIGGPNYGSR